MEKTFEFVDVNSRGQLNENDSFLLEDDAIILRGIVTLNTNMTEENIQASLAVAPQDLEFLKANRRKLSKPVNAGEFSFKEVKLLTGQGSIYITLKDGFQCLLDHFAQGIPKKPMKKRKSGRKQQRPPFKMEQITMTKM